MRPQPIDISLGGETWHVRPLTVSQVQEIEPHVSAAAEGRVATLEAAHAVLRVALRRDNPEAVTKVGELESTAGELATAMREILRLGGFLPTENAPGEAGAGRAPASPGIASTHG